jgi:hypothetical protein
LICPIPRATSYRTAASVAVFKRSAPHKLESPGNKNADQCDGGERHT